ncbi:MAG: ATP synthase F1 subunit epsilon [Wolinella sp.]
MELLRLNIVTPHGNIFSGDVKSVTLPGAEGEFGVLPGHADVLSLLSAGAIEIEKVNGKSELVAVNWGYVNVDSISVDVLADGAVAIGGDSESEVAIAIANAKTLLEEATDNNVAISAVVSRIELAAKNSL